MKIIQDKIMFDGSLPLLDAESDGQVAG